MFKLRIFLASCIMNSQSGPWDSPPPPLTGRGRSVPPPCPYPAGTIPNSLIICGTQLTPSSRPVSWRCPVPCPQTQSTATHWSHLGCHASGSQQRAVCTVSYLSASHHGPPSSSSSTPRPPSTSPRPLLPLVLLIYVKGKLVGKHILSIWKQLQIIWNHVTLHKLLMVSKKLLR